MKNRNKTWRIPLFTITIKFVRLLLNGTSALFRLLVPRIVERKQMRHDNNDLQHTIMLKNDLRLASSTYRNNVDVDIIDKHK